MHWHPTKKKTHGKKKLNPEKKNYALTVIFLLLFPIVLNIFKYNRQNHQPKWKDFSTFHEYFKAKHKIINKIKNILMQYLRNQNSFQKLLQYTKYQILETNLMVSNHVILTPKAKENWVGPVYIFYWSFFPKKHYSSWKNIETWKTKCIKTDSKISHWNVLFIPKS